MMIIHGENQTASRQLFQNQREQAKKAGKQIVDLSGADCGYAQLVNTAESVSLLGDTTAVFIDGLFSRRPSNEKKQIIEYLISRPNADITCWDAKDVTSQLKGFSPTQIKIFSLPKYIFDFLDTLSVDSYKKTIEAAPVEQVFASLVTRLHKVLTGEARIKKQLSKSELLTAYQELLQIDYTQKTSNSPFDLTTALELWLLKR